MKRLVGIKSISLFSLALMLIASIVWYLRTEKDFFLIQTLPVKIKANANQKALLRSLKSELNKPIQALKGINIWQASLKDVQQEILANKWVQKVEIRRRFPNKIDTLIQLQDPAFLFADQQNNLFPILKNGRKLPKLKANLAPAVPILRNNNILNDPIKLKQVLMLYAEVPSIGPLAKKNILEVDLNSVSGLTFKLNDEDTVVYFGTENIQTKALQVLRVIDYLKSQKQEARVIDASFSKKVLVRPRKRS